jgi:23S rRNA (uracil1939-C5)-methyltransferase
MRKKELPLLEKVEITDAGSDGNAVGRAGEMVVFVPYVIPGDVVDVKVFNRKKNFMEGRAVKLHTASEHRVEPRCSHFGLCGGCKWQNMDYAEQLFYKEKQVKDALGRIGKFFMPEVNNIIPSEHVFYYRNKLEYTFCNKRWLMTGENTSNEVLQMNGLGFHLPGRFDRVLDLEHCYLQPEPSNEIRLAVRNFTIEKGWTYQDMRNHQGLLRNLIIRTTNSGDLMVIVVFGSDDAEKIQQLMAFIRDTFRQITSLFLVVNTKANDSIADLDMQLFAGNPFIIEKMEDLVYKIGPVSFFQTNSNQALALYRLAREYAQLKSKDVVYDLYTGTGTIANFVARLCKKVIGIEYIESAVTDAKANSELNHISNTSFFAGDMAKVLNPEFVKEQGKPDVIITDPPRAGMHPKVIEQMIAVAPSRIVYISCNPATQARDITLMSDYYDVVKIQPVDMFPHTSHVENVVLLTLKNQ